MALGLLALAVCVMMVAPVAMAGKPGGGNGSRYSTITPVSESSNGFVAGPTVGDWFASYRWNVMPSPTQNYPGPGGPITVNHPVALFSDPIYSSTHGEWFYIYNPIKQSYISPSKLAQKTYYLPDPSIDVHLWILIEGITNPDKGLPGQHDTIQLTISLDTSKLPSGQQVALTIGAKQLTLTGTNVQFHYDDMHQVINWDSPLYGYASHSFIFTVDR
jgi:hypothetical protein